ncbi:MULTISPECIES: hypothetical protein [unclassified Thalassotalea]|uniref:hypothetical protein n=1 Tax=unclassified Thalassotalea TaxID=2614972 RepID=UPI0010808AD6|nr:MULTISPECIES: hypothetical protein [unclassified Thalassotalea]NMP15395.1 hypothetical protein [Thalassotalea sp. Y01]QBY05956.1 hypothetical protein E2K93_17000 [Thalassotalea sp. HSM 43]
MTLILKGLTLGTVTVLTVTGFNVFQDNETQQAEICLEQAKRLIKHPESVHFQEHKAVDVKDGSLRIQVIYTVKKDNGKRYKENSVCGFINRDSLELNPNDKFNQSRELALAER